MAITLIKEPLQFFNCTSPVIFEFTTDSVVGNFDDYVCDVVIQSVYADKTAIIKSVFPNTQTKIFSVDASEFFKALQLNGFEFDFEGTKRLSVERFEVGLYIRDGSIPDADVFSFDNYIFDNFIFTDGVGAIDNLTGNYFSILGERLLFDKFINPITDSTATFLAPDVIELCRGFKNYLSIFVNGLTDLQVTVAGLSGPVNNTIGVSTYLFTDDQLNAVRSLREVTVTEQNPNKKLQAYDFRETDNPIVQFRFFNSKGGFSYFYSELDSNESERSKVEFYDRNYHNDNEGKSLAVQSGAEYKNELGFKGSKPKQLKELFDMMLRSPKVEMNLVQLNGSTFGENPLFIECEVTGTCAVMPRTFDYRLKAKITNTGNFKL